MIWSARGLPLDHGPYVRWYRVPVLGQAYSSLLQWSSHMAHTSYSLSVVLINLCDPAKCYWKPQEIVSSLRGVVGLFDQRWRFAKMIRSLGRVLENRKALYTYYGRRAASITIYNMKHRCTCHVTFTRNSPVAFGIDMNYGLTPNLEDAAQFI